MTDAPLQHLVTLLAFSLPSRVWAVWFISVALMDAADLVNIAKRAYSDHPVRRQSALACKVARSHIKKRPASAAKRRPERELEAQIMLTNLNHAMVPDEHMRVPGKQDDAADGAAGWQGSWRAWNARSTLNIGFQSGDVTASTLSQSLEPRRSKGHIVEVQNAVAGLCLQKAKGTLEEATSVTGSLQHQWFVNDIAIDSTEFHCHNREDPAMSRHVLACHGLASWKNCHGDVTLCPLVYPPRLLEDNTSSCTWTALHSDGNPLPPIPPTGCAKLTGTVVAHDQHTVNYCLLHHLYNTAPDGHLIGSDACCQHKTANALMPMTKHLAITPPTFCLAHVIRTGSTFKDVRGHVAERLSNPANLTLVDETYEADPADREFAEALLEATYFKPEMLPAHLDMSEVETHQKQSERRRNGEQLMWLLPGNWRQGAYASQLSSFRTFREWQHCRLGRLWNCTFLLLAKKVKFQV